MNTQDLSTLYRSIQVSDESVERVIDAASGPTPVADSKVRRRLRSSGVWLPVAAAVTAVVVIALVLAGVRGAERGQGPANHPSSPTVVLPTVQPDTVSGAVLRNGQPVSDSEVLIEVFPTNMGNVPVGGTVTSKTLADVTSNEHGSFVARLAAADIANPDYAEANFINIMINVFSGSAAGTWNLPLNIQRGHTIGVRIVFDLGRSTITVDGQTNKMPMMTPERVPASGSRS